MEGWDGRLVARLFLFVALTAFLAQSYASQSHFHHWTQPDHAGIHVTDGVPVPAPDQSPFGKSPLTCPLCQAHATAGAVFVPSMPVLPAPPFQIKAPVRQQPSLYLPASRYGNSQSRAPPSISFM